MNNCKSIPRSEFFIYCKRAFESFKLSTYMTDRYLRYIEYISQYMEDMGVDSYDLNFSSAFQEKIAKADNSPNQRKSREYSCALSLIDRFIQGLPYAAQRKKLKTYNFPSNELGDYANKFIEHIKTKKRKNVTLLRYQHSMSNIVNGLSVIVKTCSDICFTIGQKNCQMFVAKLHNILHPHNRMRFYHAHSVLSFPDFAVDTFLPQRFLR